MERPTSLIWFERFYLAAFATKVLLAILNWTTTNPGGIEIGIIVSLLLWFGVMYRHSNLARWLIVGFSVVSTIWCIGYSFSADYNLIAKLLLLAIATLNVATLFQLVRADIEPWFARAAVTS